MALPIDSLLIYGYWMIFALVLLEQFGLPLPATPVLLAAGALTAQRELSLWYAAFVGIAACLIADISWFYMGRRYGSGIIRVLCRFSLESTSCVRRTQETLGKRGAYTLLIAKFVPGLSLIAAPVAGQSGMSLQHFLSYDLAGSLFWTFSALLVGRFFGDLIKTNPHLLAWTGRFAGVLLLLGILGFFAVRVYRQQRFLQKLRTARLEPEQLKEMMDSNEPVYIVDLRHPLELISDPHILPGALHLSPDVLTARHGEIPRDRDIIVYCSCPSEATAARAAMQLHKLGIDRVRPLRGGFDLWAERGYPVDTFEPVTPRS